MLMFFIFRVPQSEALRLASSGATVIHVPAEQQQQHQQQQQLRANINVEPQVNYYFVKTFL